MNQQTKRKYESEFVNWVNTNNIQICQFGQIVTLEELKDQYPEYYEIGFIDFKETYCKEAEN